MKDHKIHLLECWLKKQTTAAQAAQEHALRLFSSVSATSAKIEQFQHCEDLLERINDYHGSWYTIENCLENAQRSIETKVPFQEVCWQLETELRRCWVISTSDAPIPRAGEKKCLNIAARTLQSFDRHMLAVIRGIQDMEEPAK